MAKIKITESELKGLIRESVENVLNEALWDPSQSFGSNLRNLPGRLGGVASTVRKNVGDATQAILRGGAGNTTGMQGDINQIGNRSKYMTYSRDDLVGQITQRDKQIATLTSQNNTLSGQVATLTSENATLSGQVTTLSGQVATLTSQNNSLRSQNKALNGKINGLNQQVSSLTTRVENSRNQIGQVKPPVGQPQVTSTTPAAGLRGPGTAQA